MLSFILWKWRVIILLADGTLVQRGGWKQIASYYRDTSRGRMCSSQGFFYRISSGQLCHNKKECICRQKHLWCIKKNKKNSKWYSKVFPCINNNMSEGFQLQSLKSGNVYDQTSRSHLDSTCWEHTTGDEVHDSRWRQESCLYSEAPPLLRWLSASASASYTWSELESARSETVTGRWWSSSANLRLALLKMNQGQMKDLSGEQMNSGRQGLSFRFLDGAHTHTHMHRRTQTRREYSLNIHSLRGKVCQRELEMKKRWGRQRHPVPERDWEWGGKTAENKTQRVSQRRHWGSAGGWGGWRAREHWRG